MCLLRGTDWIFIYNSGWPSSLRGKVERRQLDERMKETDEKTKGDDRRKTGPVSEASAASTFKLDQTTASQLVKQLAYLSTFHENGVLGSLMICIPSYILG